MDVGHIFPKDLKKCLINFDQYVTVADLLLRYHCNYEDIANLLHNFIKEQEARGEKYKKRYLVHGVEPDERCEVFAIVRKEEDASNWLKQRVNAQVLLYSVEVAGNCKSPARKFKPLSRHTMTSYDFTIPDAVVKMEALPSSPSQSLLIATRDNTCNANDPTDIEKCAELDSTTRQNDLISVTPSNATVECSVIVSESKRKWPLKPAAKNKTSKKEGNVSFSNDNKARKSPTEIYQSADMMSKFVKKISSDGGGAKVKHYEEATISTSKSVVSQKSRTSVIRDIGDYFSKGPVKKKSGEIDSRADLANEVTNFSLKSKLEKGHIAKKANAPLQLSEKEDISGTFASDDTVKLSGIRTSSLSKITDLSKKGTDKRRRRIIDDNDVDGIVVSAEKKRDDNKQPECSDKTLEQQHSGVFLDKDGFVMTVKRKRNDPR